MITVSSDYYSDLREQKIDSDTPDIEFGLRCEGHIDEQLHFVTPLNYYNYRNYDFYPLTHSLDRKAYEFLNQTHDYYRSQGYFTAPFLVRYVLRDHDGKNLYVSEPEVMTAGLLPPVLELVRYDDSNGCDMHLRLTDSPVFSLMIRIGNLTASLTDRVKNIDIYVSTQIPAYTFGGGHNCNYSDVLCSIDGKAGLHGKIDMKDCFKMLKGWYADNSGKFKRHYTDFALSSKKVWYVKPNSNLVEMLVNETRFYHVASIKADQIGNFTTFKPIDIPTTLNQWIEAHDLLIVGSRYPAAYEAPAQSTAISGLSIFYDKSTSPRNSVFFKKANPDKSYRSVSLRQHLTHPPVFSTGLSPPARAWIFTVQRRFAPLSTCLLFLGQETTDPHPQPRPKAH